LSFKRMFAMENRLGRSEALLLVIFPTASGSERRLL
jgi:hypothetical protein